MRKRAVAWLAKVGIATAILAGVGVLADSGRAMASPAASHQETRS